MWVFYHKNQGHTVWYYIAVIFKAVFGDLQVIKKIYVIKEKNINTKISLQGFFTSLIYFYFNTEIRHEVLRQVQRTLSRNDTIRRSSTGETLSTRLSVFRISFSRRRSSERRRTTLPLTPSSPPSPPSPPPPVLNTRQICWKTFLAFICPCLVNNTKSLEQQQQQQQRRQVSIEHLNRQNETTPIVQSNLISEDDLVGVTSPLLDQSRSAIDNEGSTCDTVINKNENDDDDGVISDGNDVTTNQSSIVSDQTSIVSNHTSLLPQNNHIDDVRIRSKSDGHTLKDLTSKYTADNQSLR
jgi:hypothetical protein